MIALVDVAQGIMDINEHYPTAKYIMGSTAGRMLETIGAPENDTQEKLDMVRHGYEVERDESLTTTGGLDLIVMRIFGWYLEAPLDKSNPKGAIEMLDAIISRIVGWDQPYREITEEDRRPPNNPRKRRVLEGTGHATVEELLLKAKSEEPEFNVSAMLAILDISGEYASGLTPTASILRNALKIPPPSPTPS